MSRIGKSPINLPEGVSLEIAKDNMVTVKGSRGTLQQHVDSAISIKVEDGRVILERPTESKRHKAMHGLYRSLLSNAVEGVNTGYIRKLELVGVGYKAVTQGNVLELNIGYSHSVFMGLPDEVKIVAETVKGQNPIITLESIDKQLIGQVAAKIKSLRKVEPYKGKGIRFVGEQVRRKAGKTAAK
jgi:large subunit ribosomal protein L6